MLDQCIVLLHTVHVIDIDRTSTIVNIHGDSHPQWKPDRRMYHSMSEKKSVVDPSPLPHSDPPKIVQSVDAEENNPPILVRCTSFSPCLD
jgi:hypothetical protein